MICHSLPFTQRPKVFPISPFRFPYRTCLWLFGRKDQKIFAIPRRMCEGIQAHLFSLRCSFCGWQTSLYSSTGKDEWNDGDKLSGTPARSSGVGGTKKASRAVARDGSLSKMIFDKRVDGEASSPATVTLCSFCLNPAGAGRKKLQGNAFCSGKWDFPPQKSSRPRRSRRRGRWLFERASGPLELSRFFDSLATREGSRDGSDPV